MQDYIFTAIIIDDETDGRIVLDSSLRNYCPNVKVLCQCKSAEEGIEAINTLNPDIVFLDINMPKVDGFGMLDRIKNKEFHLVFVTAYSEYAIKAIKYAALDYLLKPIDPEELITTIKKCQSVVKNFNEMKINYFSKMIKKDDLQSIILPVKSEYVVIETNEIIRCEADGNYTKVFLMNNDCHLVSKTLKDFDIQLSDFNFFRIHKSHLINLKYVKKFSKNDGCSVTLVDNTELDVSRRNKDEFLRVLTT